MILATVKLKSVTPISFSRYHATPKLEKEGHDDHEKRTWRNKCHVDDNGHVMVTQFMLKNMLSESAKRLGTRIPDDRKKTFTKHFEGGVLVSDCMRLPIKIDDVEGMWLHVPSDGRRGGSKRVMKCFPVIKEWDGTALFYILDETITENVFRETLEEGGKFVGMGSLRVANNGIFGRFEVADLKWSKA